MFDNLEIKFKEKSVEYSKKIFYCEISITSSISYWIGCPTVLWNTLFSKSYLMTKIQMIKVHFCGSNFVLRHRTCIKIFQYWWHCQMSKIDSSGKNYQKKKLYTDSKKFQQKESNYSKFLHLKTNHSMIPKQKSH